MEFELYITILQTEWDMTPKSGLIAVIGFIIWMIFALPAAAAKERETRQSLCRKKRNHIRTALSKKKKYC